MISLKRSNINMLVSKVMINEHVHPEADRVKRGAKLVKYVLSADQWFNFQYGLNDATDIKRSTFLLEKKDLINCYDLVFF